MEAAILLIELLWIDAHAPMFVNNGRCYWLSLNSRPMKIYVMDIDGSQCKLMAAENATETVASESSWPF